MADLQPSSKKGKRRRQVDETELPPGEQARRQRQRELQQMAIKLRAQGQEYDARACKAQLARNQSSQKSKRKSKGSKYQVRCEKRHLEMHVMQAIHMSPY